MNKYDKGYVDGYESGVHTTHQIWVMVAKSMGKSTYTGLMRRVEAEMKRRLSEHESKEATA